MARKTTVVLEDDLDGGPASHGISFALEGVDYEIDLNDSNAAKLRDALAPYVAAGRRTGGRRQQAAPAVRGNRAKYLSDVRDWARANVPCPELTLRVIPPELTPPTPHTPSTSVRIPNGGPPTQSHPHRFSACYRPSLTGR